MEKFIGRIEEIDEFDKEIEEENKLKKGILNFCYNFI